MSWQILAYYKMNIVHVLILTVTKFNVLPRFCVLEPEPVSVADVVELVQQNGGEEFSGTAICLQHPAHEHVQRINVAVQLAGSVKQLENKLIN